MREKEREREIEKERERRKEREREGKRERKERKKERERERERERGGDTINQIGGKSFSPSLDTKIFARIFVVMRGDCDVDTYSCHCARAGFPLGKFV